MQKINDYLNQSIESGPADINLHMMRAIEMWKSDMMATICDQYGYSEEFFEIIFEHAKSNSLDDTAHKMIELSALFQKLRKITG